jgi:hypothetical protein
VSTANAYTGTVKGGKFQPDDRASFLKAFCKKDGTRMVVTAKKWVPKRSNNSNAFWWTCVIPLFQEEMGLDDPYAVHHAVLCAIGHYEAKEVLGEMKPIPKKTRDLPQDEFCKLIEKAERLFAEYYGGRLPPQDSAQAHAMMAGA